MGYTGIGIAGTDVDGLNVHSFVMAVGDNIQDEHNSSDLSINTKKAWSKSALRLVDIPDLENITQMYTAMKSFSSKENTDVILAALAISSDPDEMDNAAVVARNYSKGCIGKGQWDLPSGGILYFIRNFKDQLLELIPSIVGNNSWNQFVSTYIFSSNEYDYSSVWALNYAYNIITDVGKNTRYGYVIPVYTIK